jgi:hypothetical protein
MTPSTIEEQLDRYGRDLAERDRVGTLLDVPRMSGLEPDLPSRGADSEDNAEVIPTPYIVAPAVMTARRHHRQRGLAVAALAAIVLTVVVGVALNRRAHTATLDDITTPSTTSSPTTTAEVVVGAVGPYALPPTDVSSVRGWIDGDAYAIRYASNGHEFVVTRYAEGAPPTEAWTSETLAKYLDGRGEATEVPSLGIVFVSCGDGASLTRDGAWDWWSAAVGHWLQDGHLMSLYLVGVGEQPPISFQNGTAIGPEGSPAACPATDDAAILQDALAEVRTVGRADLDATLDSMPLSIGSFGRQIAEPRP